ncbi:hypothetical protein [Streptomyces collinus]|uniref:hypothetical protein n=1 Tax=Streptomyces collinus TaxID=42684 RepID=UPI00331D2440
MTGKRAKGNNRTYRIAGIGLVGAGLVAGTMAAAGAFAGESRNGAATGHLDAAKPAAPTIACPSVEGRLSKVPARAQAEVTRNLQLLVRQLSEANDRLARSQGEGGPDFVRNAILGPLESKRTATLNRIETAIGRVAQKPEGLEEFAPCSLDAADGAGKDGGGDGQTFGNDRNIAGATWAINCPDVASKLPRDIPAASQQGVSRELSNLQKEITEATDRLARSQAEGGPNFVRNAILGPLSNKRRSVINRIEIDIRREGGEPPAGLQQLAECQVNS